MITGTYDLVVNPQWKNINLQEVFLECDTKVGDVTINLFEIEELNRFWNVKIIISDGGNNASANNIYINAKGGDSIDESGIVQVVLNVSGESVVLQPVSPQNWIALESVGGGSGAIPTLQEVLDNNHDLKDGNNYQGTSAGLDNVGTNVNAFGEGAAQNNSSGNLNAFGFNSAQGNSGKEVNAMGYQAGFFNEGDTVNAFGSSACSENKGRNVHAFGGNAGRQNQRSNAVFIGENAGYDTVSDVGNRIGDVFVINNSVLPSFANVVDAQKAITVLNGAVAGNTYLYYDASKLAIGAIRL